MVALALLMITMIPLGYLVTNEVHQAASAKNSLTALGVAEKWMEILGTAQDPPPTSGALAVDTGRQLIPIQPNGSPLPKTGPKPEAVRPSPSGPNTTGPEPRTRPPRLICAHPGVPRYSTFRSPCPGAGTSTSPTPPSSTTPRRVFLNTGFINCRSWAIAPPMTSLPQLAEMHGQVVYRPSPSPSLPPVAPVSPPTPTNTVASLPS